MKLVSLNTWGGKVFDPLIEFIKQQSQDTDIFCLQEIYDTPSSLKKYKGIRANLLSEIQNLLADFTTLYFPVLGGYDEEGNPVNFEITTGNAIFIKNSIKINSSNNYIVYSDPDFKVLKKDFSNFPVPLQYINFNLGDKEFSLFNFHGTSFPGSKLDSNKRLTAAKKIRKIMDAKKSAKILAGDFNLLPQTESIKILGGNMQNLIHQFSIPRTRSKLSAYYGKPDFQKYADFIFVSKDIKVLGFQVPQIEISDHLPMILEFC